MSQSRCTWQWWHGGMMIDKESISIIAAIFAASGYAAEITLQGSAVWKKDSFLIYFCALDPNLISELTYYVKFSK